MDLNYLTRNGQVWVGQHSYLENFALQVSINFNIDWFVKFCCHRKIQRVMQVNGLLLSNMNVILPDAVLLEIYVISLNQKKQKGSWSDSSSVQLAVGIHPINRLLRGYNTLLNLLINRKKLVVTIWCLHHLLNINFPGFYVVLIQGNECSLKYNICWHTGLIDRNVGHEFTYPWSDDFHKIHEN